MALADDFIHASDNELQSLPDENSGGAKSNTAAAIVGTATGAITYLAAPELATLPEQGLQDEALAASAGLCALFLASMVPARLCSTKKEQQQIEKWNIIKGAGGGAMAGLGLAISLEVLADLIYTGGIITALGLIVSAGAWIYNQIVKYKYCNSCHKKDSCKHVVCRNCFKIHVPLKNPLDCNHTFALTWHAVASQLHYDGLNYPESLKLARDHFSEWEAYPDGSGVLSVIDCEQFRKWRDANKKKIMKYKNTITYFPPDEEKHVKEVEAKLGYSRAKRPN